MSTEVAPRRQADLPPALAQIGVQIATDTDGNRAVIFPAEVRQRCNLLLPVSEITHADPNFSPSVRIVQLDVAAHSYEQQGGRRALNKQGLEVLANCAGVLYQKTARIPKSDLEDTEMGYVAEVAIRRSDGTQAVFQKEKIVDREIEEFKIRSAVARLNKSDAEKHKEFDKRWAAEREHMRAKAESKAVLRALRAALQIPHTYTAAELQKPFVVVGYAFTPDYDDPEMKRLLVAAGLGAQAKVYGEAHQIEAPDPGQRAADRILPSEEQVARELGMESGAGSGAADPDEGGAGEAAPSEPTAAGDIEPTGASTEEPAAGDERAQPAAGESGSGEDTPDPTSQHADTPEPVIVGFGRHQGKSVSQIYKEDASYVEWLANAARDPQIREAAMNCLTDGAES